MSTNLVDNSSKVCAKCNVGKPLSEFYRCTLKHGKGGYRQECKACGALRNKKWREDNPDTVKGYNQKHNAIAKDTGKRRDWFLRKTYGIGLEDFIQMRNSQNEKCLICKRETELHVDHGHETGAVRGILCFNCNGGLGQFKDNPEILIAAAEYIRSA